MVKWLDFHWSLSARSLVSFKSYISFHLEESCILNVIPHYLISTPFHSHVFLWLGAQFLPSLQEMCCRAYMTSCSGTMFSDKFAPPMANREQYTRGGYNFWRPSCSFQSFSLTHFIAMLLVSFDSCPIQRAYNLNSGRMLHSALTELPLILKLLGMEMHLEDLKGNDYAKLVCAVWWHWKPELTWTRNSLSR